MERSGDLYRRLETTFCEAQASMLLARLKFNLVAGMASELGRGEIGSRPEGGVEAAADFQRLAEKSQGVSDQLREAGSEIHVPRWRWLD